MDVYIETGSKRTFACAVDYPGLARSARTEDDALLALVDYCPRYASAVDGAVSFRAPHAVEDLDVVERVRGDATTDFGAPSREVSSDARPLADDDLERHVAILRACWSAFDASANRQLRAPLRKGPRGGGRDLDKIVRHVLEADAAYFNRLGGRFKSGPTEDEAAQFARLRDDIVDLLRARGGGREPEMGRRKSPLWSPRYFVRRTAWHALDHAWEIEDRAEPTK